MVWKLPRSGEPMFCLAWVANPAPYTSRQGPHVGGDRRCKASSAPRPRLSRGIAVRLQAGQDGDGELGDKPDREQGGLGNVVEFVEGLRRFAGLGGRTKGGLDLNPDALAEGADETNAASYTPLVLVVGATGRTGRIVVRKLLFRGFRVRVLVRNLYTSTLDLLGTGCDFVQGDVLDRESLVQATVEVDKIVFAASVEDDEGRESRFIEGVRNVIAAFHDSRHFDFGGEGATKRSVFKFSKSEHLDAWVPENTLSVVREFGIVASRPARVSWMINEKKHAVFVGQVFDVYNGKASVVCNGAANARALAAVRENSGLILRCIGDGKEYSLILRTSAGNAAGVEYESSFISSGKWETVRLPLSRFKQIRKSVAKDDEEENISIPFDRRAVVEMVIQYRKPEINPEKEDGNFYLALDYMKAYQTQPETDFVLLSCAGATPDAMQDTHHGRVGAEQLVRKSGLTYTIVRPGKLSDQPGGTRALVLQQGSGAGNAKDEVSRADVAEVCVSSLLDPRASNVTFDAFESVYAPTAKRPEQNISVLFERLQPNT